MLFEDTDLAALDDDAVTRWRRASIGFVFQAFHVLPYLSVLQNVALPLELLGVRDPQRRQRALQLLEACGIAGLARAMRASCRAANCSASPSPARWCIGRGWCWPMSQPAISMRAPHSRSCGCCANSCAPAAPVRSSSPTPLTAARTADRILQLEAGQHLPPRRPPRCRCPERPAMRWLPAADRAGTRGRRGMAHAVALATARATAAAGWRRCWRSGLVWRSAAAVYLVNSAALREFDQATPCGWLAALTCVIRGPPDGFDRGSVRLPGAPSLGQRRQPGARARAHAARAAAAAASAGA